MQTVSKIHETVLKVCEEARKLVGQIPPLENESELLSELVLCILSSQEKYEAASAAMISLNKKNILRIPNNEVDFFEIKSQLIAAMGEPIYFNYENKRYSRRLRFFVKKGEHILKTLENIYLNNLTIKKILSCAEDTRDARKKIIDCCCGLGPKQASMFLRNIGYYSEFAVLDKHVFNFMKITGLTYNSLTSVATLSKYEELENKLRSYATTYNVALLHLDLAIWVTMRTLKIYR
ncbi:hypothetical protein F9K33_00410 [bacterium]|nr:MAG: hypothetical protein F9K33_00410 [bacterium]